MSTGDGESGGFVRTVTPLSDERPNQEMDVIGWLVFLVMLVVLLPLVPVFLALWVVSKLTGR